MVELPLPLPLPLSPPPPPLLARTGPTLLLAASVSPRDSLASLAAPEEVVRLALLLLVLAPAVALMDQGWSSSRGRSLAVLPGPERLEASARRPVTAAAPAEAHRSLSEQGQPDGLAVPSQPCLSGGSPWNTASQHEVVARQGACQPAGLQAGLPQAQQSTPDSSPCNHIQPLL